MRLNHVVDIISTFGYHDFMENETKPLFRIHSRISGTSGSSEWVRFYREKKSEIYPKGSIIVKQGELDNRIFFLEKGLVEYTNIDKNGAEHLMEILGPGNMLNMQPVFGKNPSIGTFAALSDCQLSFADKEEIWDQMDKNRHMMEEMFEEMAIIVGGLNRQICLGSESSDRRTCQLLYMIATVYQNEKQGQAPITIKLSQDDLARVIRTTRVTIAKCLSALKNKGILDTEYGRIRILDMPALLGLIEK